MAERRAANKYYPPDWDPSKGSINTFVGQHPLRARAKKLDQGILVIRFELPFNAWCLSCDNHIGMGVRYNAEKKRIGNYLSSPIFSFSMKCHLCSGKIEIHTDPQNAEYKIIEGLRKREESFSAKDAGTIEFEDPKERERMEQDPFYKLEHGVVDQKKAQEIVPRLTQLQELSEEHWKDPYTLSQKLRRKFREEKKERVEEETKLQGIQDRNALSIPLLPISKEDDVRAKLIEYGQLSESSQDKRRKIMTASIFPAKASSKSSSKKNKSSLLNLPSSSGNTLLQKLSMREKLKNDPFSQSAFGSGNSNSHSVESASSIKTSSAHLVTPKNHDPQEAGAGLALLGSYASSEDD